MEAVTEVVSKASDYLWNVILIILLCGTGIYFTIRLKFIQIRKFGEGFKLVFGNISLKGEKGKNGEKTQKSKRKKQEKRPQPARHPLPGRRRKQRQPVKRSLSRKSHSKRKANGAISVVASARIQIRTLFMEGISRTSLFHWKILCRKWERLSSAVRLWMWKREKSEMRRPY